MTTEALQLVKCEAEDGQQDLRAWVTDQVRNRGVAVTTIAREIGLGSHSLISQFIGGKAISKNLQDKLQELRRRSVMSSSPEDGESDDLPSPPADSENPPAGPADSEKIKYDMPLLHTEDLLNVLGVCALCAKEGELGLIVGPAGSGKTTALQEFCRRNYQGVYIRADITMSEKELLVEVGQKLGIAVSGSRMEMKRQIARQLKEEPRLLVIDEADLLVKNRSTYKLEILRGIWDEVKTGMVFCGPPILADFLTNGPGGKENLAQLYSRIRYAYYMKGVAKEEVAKAIEGFSMTASARDYLVISATAKAHGGLRRFSRLWGNTLDLARPGETITLEIVKEAERLLVSPRSLGLEL